MGMGGDQTYIYMQLLDPQSDLLRSATGPGLVHAYKELNLPDKACSHQETSVGQMAISCAPGSSDR